ncbi:hypothetical protein IC575_029427 [Cucumis melo]
MKNTANSSMLVGTLISTVVFAAAFSQFQVGVITMRALLFFSRSFGSPCLQCRMQLLLISSSTSILMFVSILTSRYAEDDFLHSLPSRFLFGLATLFISIVWPLVLPFIFSTIRLTYVFAP